MMAIRTENYFVDYRYIPGSLGDGGSLDNGAVMREACRYRKSAEARLSELKADTRIQWAKLAGSHVNLPTSSYGGPAA